MGHPQHVDSAAGAALTTAAVRLGRLLFGGAAAVYAGFALVYLLASPIEPHLPLALVFLAVGAFFALVSWRLPGARPTTLEPLMLASVLVAEAGAISFVPLTRDPKQSAVLIIVLAASGTVLPTVRATAIASVAGILGWLATATWLPPDDLLHWLVNLAAAAAVATTFGAVRLRAVAGLRLTRFLTDRAHDAIYLLSGDARIRYANDAAGRMLGFDRQELVRLVASDVDPSATPESMRRVWGELRRHGALVLPSRHRRKDGSLVPVELSLSLATLDGREYACAIVRDVTDRRAVEATLERARRAAESASQAKSDFLATMSHEIRTPLNGIFGMTEMALESEGEEERREFIQAARASAEVLLAMLNDILDHSQLEAGRLSIETVDFDLHDACRRVVSSLAADARRRGVDLSLVWAPALPARVLGDPRRVRQVIANLVVNALKFTEHGEVEIHVEPAAGSTATAPCVSVAVRDTGIGIAASNLERIFDPFMQVDSSHSRRHGGAGLGLAITRELVHAMGGSIEVSSTPGAGSTFTCRLPLAPAAQTRDSSASAEF